MKLAIKKTGDNSTLNFYEVRKDNSPPKWPSTSLFDDFFYLTDSRQGFKTRYQNP